MKDARRPRWGNIAPQWPLSPGPPQLLTALAALSRQKIYCDKAQTRSFCNRILALNILHSHSAAIGAPDVGEFLGLQVDMPETSEYCRN
jgi:hypothetical protein